MEPFQNMEEEYTSHKNETKRTKKDCQKVGARSHSWAGNSRKIGGLVTPLNGDLFVNIANTQLAKNQTESASV